MDFVETMAEYLDGYRQDVWDITGWQRKLARIEEKYPGFRDRYRVFCDDIDVFRDSGHEDMLLRLLKEGFVLDGIFEEDIHEQMLETWKRANEVKKKFMPEDIGLTRKETEC